MFKELSLSYRGPELGVGGWGDSSESSCNRVQECPCKPAVQEADPPLRILSWKHVPEVPQSRRTDTL